MHVLLIKVSSMGDIIHTLPALTDAMNAIPDLEVDWVVEPAFADIPAWHPAVKNIILIPLRQWKKNIFNKKNILSIIQFIKKLREKKYDLIIDAQGLLFKSAIVAKIARGEIHGYDKNAARDKFSSYLYDHSYAIKNYKKLHAITRTRQLFSKALKYEFKNTIPNYQTIAEKLPTLPFKLEKKYVVFLHGTTWDSKHYPESYWRELIEKTEANNITVYLPWGNDNEKKRAERLAQNTQHVKILPKLSIPQIATVLRYAIAVVSVDTGLGHLSAAVNTPTISLYGPSNAELVGILGEKQIHLQAQFPCAPCYSKTCIYARTHKTKITPTCFETIPSTVVWDILKKLI
ncbi:MAG: lipopolysaccharide heptosyltransferase I [Gammaproteobacteria bacterium RIFCSPHIGHO2_12_FULL_38_11]|nr:MAG: lipopolysaccharide heptosyltransferase I [Gammaproteobacteria bacterium RIFCSPHIGHO2_12_FULL_38_11]